MVLFKLCIADQKEGKAYQKEVKDAEAEHLVGLKIDEMIKGDLIGLNGFELKITGGSDKSGFPMRHGILGIRKKINIYGGVGFKGKGRRGKRVKGLKRRKTICGHKINENISQVNLVVVKEGPKKLSDALGVKGKEGEAKKEPKQQKAEPKETKAKESKPEDKEKKAETKEQQEKPKGKDEGKKEKPKEDNPKKPDEKKSPEKPKETTEEKKEENK